MALLPAFYAFLKVANVRQSLANEHVVSFLFDSCTNSNIKTKYVAFGYLLTLCCQVWKVMAGCLNCCSLRPNTSYYLMSCDAAVPVFMLS